MHRSAGQRNAAPYRAQLMVSLPSHLSHLFHPSSPINGIMQRVQTLLQSSRAVHLGSMALAWEWWERCGMLFIGSPSGQKDDQPLPPHHHRSHLLSHSAPSWGLHTTSLPSCSPALLLSSHLTSGSAPGLDCPACNPPLPHTQAPADLGLPFVKVFLRKLRAAAVSTCP